jgi:hypothetical protein
VVIPGSFLHTDDITIRTIVLFVPDVNHSRT